MQITELLKVNLNTSLFDDELKTEEDKEEFLNNIEISKEIVFKIPVSYDYETKNNEYFKIICKNIDCEFDTEYYQIQDIYYINESAKSSLTELKLNEEEQKTVYKKYNFHDYLREIERIIL